MRNTLQLGIFGRTLKPEHIPDFKRLISWLIEHKVPTRFNAPFARLCGEQGLIDASVQTFASAGELRQTCNLLVSLGGDGTLLDAVSLVGDSGIPVVGLNFGKLGFLAPIDAQFLEAALADLCAENYDIEHRSLLQMTAQEPVAEPFALNDITFKSEAFGMLSVEVYVDGQFLNTYVGDGLLVSTPTGSTAYNLSCGGPILPPENRNFILTPIASHTLTVRPLVIPDASKIEVRVTDPKQHFHTTLDSRRVVWHGRQTFNIEKAPFNIHTIRLRNQHFFETIRAKLMWGKQARNLQNNTP